MPFKRLTKTFKPFVPEFMALLSGLCIPLSLAPINQTVLAFISPALLLMAYERKSEQALRLGYLHGIGLFGLGVSWVFVSIYLYGESPVWLAGLLTAAFILGLSLFPALLMKGYSLLFQKPTAMARIIGFACLWTLVDGLRGHLLTGFPWAFIGYSQLTTHLSDLAAIGSVYLVTAVTVATSGALYHSFHSLYFDPQNRKTHRLPLLVLTIIWGTAFWSHHQSFVLRTNDGPTVAMVQGNVQQSMRWEPAQLTAIINTYESLSTPLWQTFDWVIWPESAIPYAIPAATSLLSDFHQVAKANNSTLMLGIPEQVGQTNQFYNDLVSIGAGSGRYQKQRLVPFGEYVPLERWLRGLINFFDLPMSSFVPGKDKFDGPIRAGNWIIGPAICYEIAYPALVQSQSSEADAIVTISNDAWFGSSWGPHQHLQMAQFRALENGIMVLRSTNSGISAFIDVDGTVLSQTDLDTRTVLKGQVFKAIGQTPWQQLGPFAWWGLWALMAILLACSAWLSRR